MTLAQAPAALNERFGLPGGAIRFEAGPGGLVRAVVTARAAEAHISLYGAQVTHHRPAGGEPTLFLSPQSRFEAGKAIRGGVPVVFPWFGARAGHPAAPDHGFARTSAWTVEAVADSGDGGISMTLGLAPGESTRAVWPHEFRIAARIEVGAHLGITLEVENRSDAAFSFEEALHTYLRVGDAARASIAGLAGATYLDKTDGFRRKTLGAEPFRLAAETDRVFLETPGPHVVTDPVLGRRLIVEKRHSANTVVWNPWRERAAGMADLGPDHWRQMLCVEAANVGDSAVRLEPGARHAMGMVLRAEAEPAGS
jgi:glucose-6-phosphate 1-epimerase